MADIEVSHPSPEEIEKLDMSFWGQWEKEPSTFDWEYDTPETFYVYEGKVTIKTEDGQEVQFGKGDLVKIPKGIKCTWTVHETIKKAYRFM